MVRELKQYHKGEPVVKGVVEVHSCYSIEQGEARPIPCACRKVVSVALAHEMIKRGEAEWVVGYDKAQPYHEGMKICLTGRTTQTPRCATIEKAHIERAYVNGNLEEVARIEEYGALTRAIRESITKMIPEEEFLRNREQDWGIPVLQFIEDNRTPGGVNREDR